MAQISRLKVRMADHVGLRVKIVVTPRGWRSRIWCAGLIFRLGAAVLGLPVEIETTAKAS